MPFLFLQVRSIYSGYYAAESGPLQFDHLPWFSVAHRLRHENGILMEERESFKRQLAEHRVMSNTRSIICLPLVLLTNLPFLHHPNFDL